ncbi:MAG: PRD domain-containing protein, partial [Lachnospiraceae bacterium]|nr:PRD domain-containing protein [Lachnospiraceae bacterium]
MYRIEKVLNHNTVIAIATDPETGHAEEFLVLEKGIGFGKKVSETVEFGPDAKIYGLNETTDRGSALDLVKQVPPIYLEIANEVLQNAERIFEDEKVDHSILFPLADHLEFAAKRIKNHEDISNPLLDDIKILFHMEYKAAECIRPMLIEEIGVEVSDDEIGYVALHVHSAISHDRISQSMQIAQSVRDCISRIEEQIGHKIRIDSLSYNRMMNHIRYMVARVQRQEPLKISMNDFVNQNYPEAFVVAERICDELAESLGIDFDENEIGYLA